MLSNLGEISYGVINYKKLAQIFSYAQLFWRTVGTPNNSKQLQDTNKNLLHRKET